MTAKNRITVAHGDGIGPEIMAATLNVLDASGADLEIETIEIGESVYKQGFTSGIKPEAWESIRRTGVFLKAPITTPQGGGYKSLNVTIRKSLGLFANIRPCVTYSPYVKTKHPSMDVVIVRENEEDLYAGIEHRQTVDVMQCLKLISRQGSERVVRYAFEYARQQKRSKVTCFTKDNIMKLTDGLFHEVFTEVAKHYPEIESEHMIVDIGAARLADTPEMFDVLVLPNLYGDILSDVAAQLTGSVGLASSANVGERAAMFEAIHGSAPPLAGRNVANPSGLLLAAVQMLVHLGQSSVAERIQNAWLSTIEDGIHTFDLHTEAQTKEVAGTDRFGEAVIERLGQIPKSLRPVAFSSVIQKPVPAKQPSPVKKQLVGVDVFLDWREGSSEALGAKLSKLESDGLKLEVITNRGVKVWPEGLPETFCTSHWRCRYMKAGSPVSHDELAELMKVLAREGIDFIKTENLYDFDGKPGYSLGQGQ